MHDPLTGFTPIQMPNALQRTLTTALGAGQGPTFELWLPPSATAPQVKESPAEHVRAVEGRHPFPAEWMRDLRSMSPISMRDSWLAPRWVVGTPDTPVGRWLLYECSPLMSEEVRTYLGGTPWWEMPEGQQYGRRQLVSAYQWEMYRKHQVWARPFWCLQGDQGGTPAAYSDLEQKMLRLTDQPHDPPAYGSLPFAPWDGRAKQRIREREKLWKLGHVIGRLTRQGMAEHLRAETAEAERQFRAAFLRWIDDRFAPQADFLDWFSRRTESEAVLTKVTDAEIRATHEHEEAFITRGYVPAPPPGQVH